MSNQKFGMMERVLAVVLSIVILVGVLPVMSFAADETDYTLTFLTGAGAPIEGVKVNYDVFRNGEEMYPGTVNATGSDGVAVVDLSAVSTEFEGGDEITIEYTATKTGYAEVSDTIVVNALNGNTDVTMTQTEATIQVSVTGSGEYTVKLDGAKTTSKTVDVGTQVQVEIAPETGSYVKTASDGIVPATHGNTYTHTITVNNDMMLNATVVKEYTLTATGFDATEEGSVTFTVDEGTSVTKADEGTPVKVAVTPGEGYQIESVKIGSAVQTVDDVTKFSTTITVDANVEVVATFVKVYTVTVNFGNNGTVTYNDNPVTTGGSTYVVKNGETFSLKATPNANYRVSEVKVNDVGTFVGENNNEAYEVTDLTPTQNYTYAITFAPNRFAIDAAVVGTGGTVSAPAFVDFNGKATITLQPNVGYSIKSVTVNGDELPENAIDIDNNTFEIGKVTNDAPNVTADYEIRVTYEATSPAGSDELAWNYGDALRQVGNTYIFDPNTVVTFKGTGARANNPIRVTFGDTTRGGKNDTSVSVDKNSTNSQVKKVELRYKQGQSTSWHSVQDNGKDVDYKIVFDTTEPTPTLTMPAGNGFYNSDVEIAWSAEDKGDYSGIQKVQYKIYKDGTATESGDLYTYQEGEEIYAKLSDADVAKKIVVNSKTFNSESVKVELIVTDRAGNENSVSTENFAINTVAPTATVKFDNNTVVSEADSRGYFAQKRIATVTITDRADTFDVSKVEFEIDAKDFAGNVVKNAYTIDWSLEGDAHTATVAFNADANYEWSFAYTNKAGLSVGSVDASESLNPFAFTVDTTDPTGTITTLETTWDRLIDVLTFGLFSKDTVEVTGTWEDATSPIASVEYYKTADTTAKTHPGLDAVTEWDDFGTGITVPANEQFTVYLKITDAAGNYSYISTDGVIVDNTDGEIGFKIPTDFNEGQNGFYTSDVEVAVTVEDASNDGVYSGLNKITYEVFNGKELTQSGTLFTFNKENPTKDDLVQKWASARTPNFPCITVEKEKNNSDDVRVVVTAVDNAGNEFKDELPLMINATAPTAKVEFNDEDTNKNGYYGATRTATITIFDRESTFNPEAVNFTIMAKDSEGNDVANACEISDWSLEGDAHTATVAFNADANYNWEFKYENKAGLALSNIDTDEKENPFTFTVDTTAPTVSVTAEDVAESGRNLTWDALATSLTFGFWSQEGILITGDWADATSPIQTTQYYKVSATNASDNITAMTTEELDAVTDWKPFAKAGFTVSSDEQFTVYLKITDAAGNVTYVSTSGLIVDATNPVEEIAPEVSVKLEEPINGIFKDDVKPEIKVTDPLTGGTYSGLNKVTYEVFNMGELTQSGELFAFDKQNPTQKELLQEWNGSIVVDSALNNSNDVKIKVTAWDNAGNTSFEEVAIKIDVTAPVIDVSYDNNDMDSGKYYKADRTATVVVTERNFDPNDVKVTITNTHNVIPEISAFTKTEGNGNGDNTTWTATIPYTSDGDYTFEIACTDQAGNVCNTVNYVGKNPNAFTIDKTKPVINVSYNNNSADSGKYFKDNRTATVTITERNFDPSRVKVAITNTHGVVPTISAFTKTAGDGNGDNTTWTATIPYTADGDYTFAISCTDQAGNISEEAGYGNSVQPTKFTIDKTKPTVAVSYDNNSAQNGNYYKASRTATIVIKEHNFSAERVNVSIKATNDGASRAVPNVSAWRSEGDTHVATISYVNDAKYTFDIDYTDLAGNKTSDFKEQTFYVDKTKPTLEFRGVEENKPYPDVIQPVVALMDTNFDMNRVTIRLSGANRKNVELLGSYANVHNGRQFVFADFAHEQEIDDIYTLSASLTDKAGNTTEKTITFSVNRFGSVYSLSESASKLNGTYVKEPQDVVFTETNANAVKNVKMTLFKNDQTIVLEEGKDYSVSLVGGGNTWYQYTYTVFADVFKDDGVYKLTVHSEDAAGNVAENTLDTKKTAINFGVDSTKPTITVANLDNDKTYAVESLNVVLSANDNLMLHNIEVFLDDYNTAYRSWGEEEIAGILAKNSGFSFDVSGESTKAHKVKIVCTDAAGNVTVEEITNFYVTTDMFVRYFNNKPLFFGSIGGVVAAAGLIVFLIVKKRKKDDDEEAA